jgi:hypothetical protein
VLYLDQKDELTLPGNLQNRKYGFLLPPNVVSHDLPTFFLLLLLLLISLCLSLSKNIVQSPSERKEEENPCCLR